MYCIVLSVRETKSAMGRHGDSCFVIVAITVITGLLRRFRYSYHVA